MLNLLKSYNNILTVEEHQVVGGLGSLVAEFVVKHGRVSMDMIGVKDRYGQSGKPDELYDEYGISSRYIVEAAKALAVR